MTTQAEDTTIVRTAIDVGAPPDIAFAVFTDGIDR